MWCGVEYQVASHLIAEGLIDEGMAVVKGTRDRHQGDKRNPWDEFECGHHYARSMASYALLLSLSGLRYRAAEDSIGFAPRIFEEDFRSFFCVGPAWGLYSQKITEKKTELSIRVEYGFLLLRRVITPYIGKKSADVEVSIGGLERQASIEKAQDGYAVVFERPIEIDPGHTLKITIG